MSAKKNETSEVEKAKPAEGALADDDLEEVTGGKSMDEAFKKYMAHGGGVPEWRLDGNI